MAHDELLAQLARCMPPVPVLALDRLARARRAVGDATLLSAVERLVGEADPTDGSPSPAAA